MTETWTINSFHQKVENGLQKTGELLQEKLKLDATKNYERLLSKLSKLNTWSNLNEDIYAKNNVMLLPISAAEKKKGVTEMKLSQEPVSENDTRKTIVITTEYTNTDGSTYSKTLRVLPSTTKNKNWDYDFYYSSDDGLTNAIAAKKLSNWEANKLISKINKKVELREAISQKRSQDLSEKSDNDEADSLLNTIESWVA